VNGSGLRAALFAQQRIEREFPADEASVAAAQRGGLRFANPPCTGCRVSRPG